MPSCDAIQRGTLFALNSIPISLPRGTAALRQHLEDKQMAKQALPTTPKIIIVNGVSSTAELNHVMSACLRLPTQKLCKSDA